MKEIRELLNEARWYIDGKMDCRTAEYHALDQLERAVSRLAERVEEIAPEIK